MKQKQWTWIQNLITEDSGVFLVKGSLTGPCLLQCTGNFEAETEQLPENCHEIAGSMKTIWYSGIVSERLWLDLWKIKVGFLLHAFDIFGILRHQSIYGNVWKVERPFSRNQQPSYNGLSRVSMTTTMRRLTLTNNCTCFRLTCFFDFFFDFCDFTPKSWRMITNKAKINF